MDIVIKIGKAVEGSNAHVVPASHIRVSRRHATLYWHDGIATLEDNDSSNGTFVNGKRIAKTKVTENDEVWLGGNDHSNECYKLDLKKLFASFQESESAQKTDYSQEFQRIKHAYINYQAEVSELRKKVTKKSQMPRLLATLIPAVLGLIILLCTDDATLKIAAMSIGSVMSGIVGIITMSKSSSVNDQLSEAITELQIKYQKDYRCPKCGKEFNMNMHWKKLAAGGKCPFGCGAEFVK